MQHRVLIDEVGIATFQKKPIRPLVQTPRAENRSTALARITMGMFLPGAEERNQA